MPRIVKPPDWATWSLGRAPAAEEEKGVGPSVLGTLNGGEDVQQEGASAKLTSLLRHRDDEDVSRSLWHEFGADVRNVRVKEEEDGADQAEDVRQRIDAILVELEKDETSLQETYRKFRTKVRVALRPEEPKAWDYLPLTPTESQTLRRCLRLSKYVHDPQSDETATRHQRNDSERATVSPAPEGIVRAPKKVLKSMLATFMPTRNFDWILVNLQHARALLGLEAERVEPPEWQRAKDAVRQGTLEPQNAAMVLYALAQASGLKGSRSVEVNNGDQEGDGEGQRRETAGVIRALRALFPNFFSDDGGDNDAPISVESDVLEGYGKLRRAIIEYCVQAEEGRPVHKRRSASGSGSRTSPSAEIEGVAKVEPEESVGSDADANVMREELDDRQAASSDDSDWADLDYDGGPFQLTHMAENKTFEELTPYEQAMVTSDGKLPYRVKKRLKREARALRLNEKRKLEGGGAEQVEKLRRRCERFEAEIRLERKKREDQERRFARTLEEKERKAEKAYKHDVRALLQAEKDKRKQARLARMGDQVPKKRGRPRKKPLPEEEAKLRVQQPESKARVEEPAEVKDVQSLLRSFEPALTDAEADSSADVDEFCGGV